MLQVLFQQQDPIYDKTTMDGSGGLKEFFSDYANFFINQRVEEHGQISALVMLCVMVIVLFFFKNLFGYLAKYFIASLQNGMLRDIRYKIYEKITELPLSFFTEI